jgi:hypothetical protein
VSPAGRNRLGAALEQIGVDDCRMDSGPRFFPGPESARVDRIRHRVEYLTSRPRATAACSPTFLCSYHGGTRRRNAVRDEFEQLPHNRRFLGDCDQLLCSVVRGVPVWNDTGDSPSSGDEPGARIADAVRDHIPLKLREGRQHVKHKRVVSTRREFRHYDYEQPDAVLLKLMQQPRTIRNLSG